MAWFEKKIEIEIPDGRGGMKRVRVSEKEIEKCRSEGRIRSVNGCRVHICSVDGDRELIWEIGNQIAREKYEQVKDADGDLYVIEFYRDGEGEAHFVNKSNWLKVKQAKDNV